MSIRTAIVKAFAPLIVGYEDFGNGNGAAPDQKGLSIVADSLGYPSTNYFWPQHWDGTVGRNQELSRHTAFAFSALIYICIKKRQEILSQAPLAVAEETDDGFEWLDDHPQAGLLKHPNADFSMERMLGLNSIYQDIWGSTLWLKVRDRGNNETKQLHIFAGGGMGFTVESTDDRLFGLFRIKTRAGELEKKPEDVIFFPGIDPCDPLGAVSRVDIALRVVGLDEELTRATKSSLAHAMAPSGVLSVPEMLNEDEFNFMQGKLLQQHTGMNRGMPLLLYGGATWESIQMTLNEMMSSELVNLIEARVCAVFGLHPAFLGVKVGLENSSGLASGGMDIAKRMLYDEMAIPRWTSDANVLTEQLLRDTDTEPSHSIRFYTDEIPALQDDVATNAKIAVDGLGWMTVDEKRALGGYDPKGGEIGETIFVPATWMPAEMLVNPPEPKPVPAAFGGGDESDPENDPDNLPDEEE